MATHPIRRIREDGRCDALGSYDADARRLILDRPGYPLLGPGSWSVDGDLPSVFHDMAPDGFLAPCFAAWFPELGLPGDRARWSPAHVLTAVTRRGHDLPGNLVIGDESWERYRRIFDARRLPGPPRDRARDAFPGLLASLHDEGLDGSSLGGQRPKFSLRLEDGAGLLVKLTPPLGTPLGQRWGDLLRMEAHCAAILGEASLPAVTSAYVEVGDRGYLEVERFDRLAGGGRRGTCTLWWLGAERYQEIADPMKVARHLVMERLLGPQDEAALCQAHLFSAAIGNTDAHLGNYSLCVAEGGAVSLAPLYDVTPMALAPRHDELPDAALASRRAPPPDPEVAGMVDALVARAEADAGLSRDFLEVWLGYLGRG